MLDETLLEPATAATATGRSASGEPVRALAVSIRYPAAPAGGPFPLIVFSQGYDTSVSAYAGLLDAWTRAGFTVASPTYPHTDPAGPGELDESDIVNHPGDLRFVIRSLARQAGDPASPLRRLVNAREIAVAGQSDGGDVSLAVAADSCCLDSAVRAAVIMSGAELPSFGGAYYADGSVPLLVTQGSADTINVPPCSAQLYDQAPQPKYYVDLLAQSHLPPYVEPGPARDYVAKASIAFLRAYLQGRAGALRALVAAGGAPGVATITSAAQLAGAGTACP